MSGENEDEEIQPSGKRQFYIDSILHRKKLDSPNRSADGKFLNGLLNG